VWTDQYAVCLLLVCDSHGWFSMPVLSSVSLPHRFQEKIDFLGRRFQFDIQVGGFNERLFSHKYRPSYPVMQFPYVPRPAVREKQLFRFRTEAFCRSFQFSGKLFSEMMSQRQNVIGAFMQGRQDNLKFA